MATLSQPVRFTFTASYFAMGQHLSQMGHVLFHYGTYPTCPKKCPKNERDMSPENIHVISLCGYVLFHNGTCPAS